MGSVVFMLSLAGIGRAVGSVASMLGGLAGRERFEISQDGEYLFAGDLRYDFVGFSPREHYETPSGASVVPGRRLGFVTNEDGASIRSLKPAAESAMCRDTYVMLSGANDLAEIYRLHI